MNRRCLSLLTVVIACALFSPAAARASLVGVISGFSPSELVGINTTTGLASVLTEMRIDSSGLTYDSTRDRLYVSDPYNDKIYAVDLQTYAITEVFAGGLNVGSLAYDASSDTLYAAVVTLNSKNIYAISASDFTATNLGDPGIGTIYALGFNSNEGKLYALGTGENGFSGYGDFVRFDNLANFNQKTLVSQLHGQGFMLVEAMAFDAATDSFYASATNQPFRSLISIDASTGVASTIGSFDIGNSYSKGLAVIPEPGAALLLLPAVLACVQRRRPAGW